MKPNLVADEMFPEGAGPYMDLEEVFLMRFFYVISNFFYNYVFAYLYNVHNTLCSHFFISHSFRTIAITHMLILSVA